MNKYDSEINYLLERVTLLEKQKKIESEKVTNPLKTLKSIIDEKKSKIDRNCYSKTLPLARYYDKEKIEMLEPIYYMLKNIQERLDVLEKQKS
jgi:hypothetical protein